MILVRICITWIILGCRSKWSTFCWTKQKLVSNLLKILWCVSNDQWQLYYCAPTHNFRTSVLFRFTDYDYPFGIFKLFLKINWMFILTCSSIHCLICRHFCHIDQKGVFFYSKKIREITVVLCIYLFQIHVALLSLSR